MGVFTAYFLPAALPLPCHKHERVYMQQPFAARPATRQPPSPSPSSARFCLFFFCHFVLFSSLAFVPLKNRKKKEMTSFSNGCCIRLCPTPSSFSRFRVGASWSGRSRLWRVCTSCLTRQTGMSEVSSLVPSTVQNILQFSLAPLLALRGQRS